MQALLLSERQAAEEARKSFTDAEVRNAELAKKLEDAEQKGDHLQESVQRFLNIRIKLFSCQVLFSC